MVTGLVSGAAAAPANAVEPASPWLQPDYNGAGTRANLAEHTLDAGNVGTVRLLRSIDSAGTYCGIDTAGGVSAAAFSDSHTYLVNGAQVVKYVTATGQQVWSAPIPSPGVAAQAILVSHGLAVVVGNECGDGPDRIYLRAFDTTTGKLVWSQSTVTGAFVEQVSVTGKYFLLHADLGDNYGELTTVYRVQSGTVAWTHSGSAYCNGTPYVVGGLAFYDLCSTSTAGLAAVALSTGKRVWTRAGAFATEGGDTDATGAQHLFLHDLSNGTLLDADPRTGKTRRTLADAQFVQAVDQSRVYAVCDPGSSTVCAYSLSTGAKIWTYHTLSAGRPAVEANGLLYLNDGTVLSTVTGLKVTALDLGPLGPQILGNGRIGSIAGDGSEFNIYGLPGE